MLNPAAPWKMWGTSERLTVVSGAVGPANATVSSSQLAKVSYRRPDTWRFMFTGRLIGGTVGAVATTSVHALFDVFVGVGRSVLDTQKPVLGVPVNFNAFAQMRWDVAPAVQPGQQNYNIKFCTQVLGPPLDDSALTTLQVIDHIPAENISCRVRLVMSSGDPGVEITAELGAYFAPNVHVRPDWASEDYRGGETGGT
jgi:hypothetical protein